MLRNCCALSVIPWVYYYTGGLSGPFGGLQVLFLRQQQMDCRTVQMKISELRSWKITTWTLCQVQPVYQQFELSGERGKHRLLSVWQHGKWLKFPCCIWVSHRGSFAWKALTVYVITRPRPWSWRFSTMICFLMSRKSARSHRHFLFWSYVMSFPLLSRNWQISSCNSKNPSSTFTRLSRHTSVW